MCTCRSITRQIETLIFRYIHSNNKTLNLYTLLLLGNSQAMSSPLCGEHKSLSVHEMWNRVNIKQRKPLSILIYVTLYLIHPKRLDSYTLQDREDLNSINYTEMYIMSSMCMLYHYILNRITRKF